MVGTLAGKSVAFLARHGRGHRISPSELNFRANIWAMKSLGVERIVSLSAVGSLKEEHRPLDFVIPDQFFDRTRGRVSRPSSARAWWRMSASPIRFARRSRKWRTRAATQAGVTVKKGGTYLCMEGPAFSTKAESNVYRSWGMDVIGMTNLQEAKLAREAEICYATIAMVTDYDCWHRGARRSYGERHHRQPHEERRKRRESGGRGCSSHAGSESVQVRLGALSRADYRPQGGSRRYAKETGSADWKVFRVKKRRVSCWATVCGANNGRASCCSS